MEVVEICCCLCLLFKSSHHDDDNLLHQPWCFHCQPLSVSEAISRDTVVPSLCSHFPCAVWETLPVQLCFPGVSDVKLEEGSVLPYGCPMLW